MAHVIDVAELVARTKAEPRPYQIRIVGKVADCFLNQDVRSVLIDSPTGAGKTTMALLACKLMQEQKNVRIGWVAMRRNLLTQVIAENKKMCTAVELVPISMFQKQLPTGLNMLVVDEAQHDAAGSMGHIHAAIKPQYVLGMSATPFRADRVKLCFDKVIKDAGIHRLIQEGYLSHYHHYTIKDWKPATVVACYLREPERWGKSVMYFHTLADCQAAWYELTEANIPCAVVDGGSATQLLLDDFEKGKLKILINCMKLTEGLNVPDLKTVFARPSIKSVTIQMGGRVLRVCPTIPIKQIVQSENTKWPFTRTAAADLLYVQHDNEWRTLQPNQNMDLASLRSRVAVARSTSEVPKYILNKCAKGPRNNGGGRGRRGNADGDGNAVPTSGVHDEDTHADELGGATQREANRWAAGNIDYYDRETVPGILSDGRPS